MNPGPEEYSFSRYLAAKAGLDDRSLNRQVREALAGHFREQGNRRPSGCWRWAAASAPCWSASWIGGCWICF